MGTRSPKRFAGPKASSRADNAAWVERMAGQVTRKAYDAALETGHPVMVVQDGWICKVFKGGGVERIRAVAGAPEMRGRTFAL